MKVLILTPLSLERDAVLLHLSSVELQQEGGRVYFSGQFQGRFQAYQVFVSETGPKNSVVALAAEQAIQFSNPIIAILTGIAGGVKDVAIGDVVVGKMAYGYEAGKETGEGFVYRPNVHHSSKLLLATAQVVGHNNEWQKRCNPPTTGKVVFGPIASGDKVIATKDSAIYRNIKKHMNDTVALEMEAAGFGEALSNHPQILSINIRSISDLLDHKSAGDEHARQRQAAANATAFLFEILYQLEGEQIIKPIMQTAKELAKTVYQNIEPSIDAVLSGQSGEGVLWQRVKPLIANELEELKTDPTDDDLKADIRNKLKKLMNKDEALKAELAALLKDNGAPNIDNSTNISNSKNVVQGSTISVGGNFHLGDKTEVGKKYEVKDVQGNVYIADTINIEQASSEKGAPLAASQISAVKMQVIQNKIKPTLKTLLAHTAHDGDLHNQVILLASRWNQLQQEKNLNIISHSHAQVEFNRIRAALLDTIDEMEGGTF